ncbi:MAG TPA: type I methionyl aminopeptidase [Clostridia bacterium]|nr:type I methionyl aminopeptidase [Bacillota bacterium]HQI17649.1 type I methionyl aminopeptidase [Bacillota bacterium]HQJ36817.1 type I methionyl aminopeptidase [Bacillota bacterium]HRS20225.1 type I methionyl aminopeptidase [Clostridia bacterium]
MISIKSPREIELMRIAGRIVAETLELLSKAIRPGITTLELDTIAEEYIRERGAIPAFKDYNGFPASICSSINEQVVHGIPGPIALKDGDIIGIDIGAVYDGYYGDAARTYGIGNIDKETERLIKVTEESFFKGIEYALPGNRLSDISHSIQKHVESNGFSVVRDFVGHGIGRRMHEDPQIPNYGLPHKGPRLAAGMALAIEPMVNQGRYAVKIREDGWTVVTADGKPSAHYENTIVITNGKPEILTLL